MIARIFFCAAPALVAGLAGAIIHPLVGAVFGFCVFRLGWDVTGVRHD